MRGRAVFLESLARSRELGSRAFSASALEGLGDLAWLAGDHAGAAVRYTEGLALVRRTGPQMGHREPVVPVGLAPPPRRAMPAGRRALRRGLPSGRNWAARCCWRDIWPGAAAWRRPSTNRSPPPRLLGAAAGLLATQGAHLPAALRHAAAQRGGDPRPARDAAFRAAWSGAHTLPLDEALALAGQALAAHLPPPAAAPPWPIPPQSPPRPARPCPN